MRYTREMCAESAKQYKTRNDWRMAKPGAYGAAKRFGIFEWCCQHMEPVVHPRLRWTKEKCIESARKYKTKGEWHKAEQSAYAKAKRMEWFKECVAHMPIFAHQKAMS